MTTRPAPTASLRSRLGGAVLALMVATGLGACQVASPITTDLIYDPADGVSVDVGAVAVRDLLVVSEGDGAAGVVSGLVVNNHREPVVVTLTESAGPLSPTVEVPPGGAVRLDGRDPLSDSDRAPVVIPAVPAAAGSWVTLLVSTSAGDSDTVLAPVLLPTGPYAEHVVDGSDLATER